MKVKATQAGFHTRYQKPGDTFDVDEKQFSETWMEKVRGKRGSAKAVEEAQPKEAEAGS